MIRNGTRQTHQCPGPGCTVQVPYELLACPRHWYQVPQKLRHEVWRAYRRLQGAHDDPIEAEREHDEACRQAIATMRP